MDRSQTYITGGIIGLVALILIVVTVRSYADATNICKGKTDERCEELTIADCERQLTAFNEKQRTEKLEWRRDHEDTQGTTDWARAFRDQNDSWREERNEFLAELRGGRCSVMFGGNQSAETEEEASEASSEESSS